MFYSDLGNDLGNDGVVGDVFGVQFRSADLLMEDIDEWQVSYRKSHCLAATPAIWRCRSEVAKVYSSKYVHSIVTVTRKSTLAIKAILHGSASSIPRCHASRRSPSISPSKSAQQLQFHTRFPIKNACTLPSYPEPSPHHRALSSESSQSDKP